MSQNIYILGITCYGAHDSSAALICNGKVVAAAEEERFTRIKHDRSFPFQVITYLLEEAGISINQISHAAYFYKPFSGLINSLQHLGSNFKNWKTILFGSHKNKDESRASRFLEMWTVKKNLRKIGYVGAFHYVDHHLCHAASSYFASGFPDAAILTLDGIGERASTVFAVADGFEIKPFKQINFPQSLGFMYGAVTQYLGYEYNSDEYKTMGLAPYSKGSADSTFREILKYSGDGNYQLDLSFFNFQNGMERWYSDKMVECFGPARLPDMPFEQKHMDIAGGLQRVLEEVVLEMARFLKEKTQKKNLCLAGGVALNCSMNGKLMDSRLFEEIFIQPAAHDSGTALGAAYSVYYNLKNIQQSSPTRLEHVYLGPQFDSQRIEDAIKKSGLRYEKASSVESSAAKLLSEGKVLGWFQGRMEFGPRALGNRSILGDPRNPKMKEIINAKVKFRESYRPFAPSILKERAKEYFDLDCGESPFMLFVRTTHPEKKGQIPAVVHIDRSARVQTVDKQLNARYWKLISEFEKITGTPVILNTSFNVNGEPIVNTPEDAIRCFLHSGIDGLVMDQFILSK